MAKILYIKGADFSQMAIGQTVPLNTSGVPIISVSTSGSVTITCSGATSIYYTTDGSTPTSASTKYTSSFNVESGTTIKAIAELANGSMSSVSTYTYSSGGTSGGGTSATHAGASYFFPLKTSSAATEGTLSVNKEVIADYSDNGANVCSSGSGIVYEIPNGSTIKAIAMDFMRVSDAQSSGTGYLFGIGNYDGSNGYNGWYSFINTSNNKLGCSKVTEEATSDVSYIAEISSDEYHRICFASIGGTSRIYLDGERIDNGFDLVSARNINYLIIGNGWRFRVNDGDRAFGGYIRNVAVWTNDVTEADLVSFSTLA